MRFIPTNSTFAMISGRAAKCVLACAVLLVVAASSAFAVPVLIDDFSTPANPATYVITLVDPDPLVLKQAGGIGGERDVFVDVLGAQSAISAVGTIGGGNYTFGTTGKSPSSGVLQYDGVDVLDTGAGLVNAQGLNVDITGGGTNDRIKLDFNSIDAAAATTLSVKIELTSALGSAVFNGAIPENANPSSYSALFGLFATAGAFNPTAVTSIQVTFNGAAVKDADFQIDAITAVPEPSTWVLLACGSMAALAVSRRRRVA